METEDLEQTQPVQLAHSLINHPSSPAAVQQATDRPAAPAALIARAFTGTSPTLASAQKVSLRPTAAVAATIGTVRLNLDQSAARNKVVAEVAVSGPSDSGTTQVVPASEEPPPSSRRPPTPVGGSRSIHGHRPRLDRPYGAGGLAAAQFGCSVSSPLSPASLVGPALRVGQCFGAGCCGSAAADALGARRAASGIRARGGACGISGKTSAQQRPMASDVAGVVPALSVRGAASGTAEQERKVDIC